MGFSIWSSLLASCKYGIETSGHCCKFLCQWLAEIDQEQCYHTGRSFERRIRVLS